MSYGEFGELRLLDFFPKTKQYSCEDLGATEIFSIGPARREGLGAFTYFAGPVGSVETAVIKLDFEEECPEQAGNALLKRLGLNVHKGMDYADVKRALGTPAEDFGAPDANSGVTEVRYIVGSTWQYCVHCFITAQNGLTRLWIFRKDLVDRFRDWQSSF